MQDTNDDDFVGTWKVIDRVILVEDYPQMLSEMRTRRPGKGELQCLIESALNAGEKVTGK
jgi:hypothetical protein